MSNSNRVGEQVIEMLEKYYYNLNEDIHRALKQEMQKARKEVSAASPKRTGKYAAGWSVKDESTKITTDFKIYNKLPGLPHLLEFGHVIRNGTERNMGEAPAYPHIAAVNESLHTNALRAIEKAIRETTV